jgi:hypothetical protein
VITGYNTEVKHNGRAYHVQTEDRGVENPSIESLIYVGGKIIASRQYEYGWLLREGYSEEALQVLVDIQHRKMLRDIHAGKFEPGGPPPFGAGIISQRSFDEVVLEFVQGLVASEGVEITAAGRPSPRAGDLLVLELGVVTSVRGKPIDRARVVIKARRPGRKTAMTLFDGRTDDRGNVRAGFEIPLAFGGGSLTAEATCPRGKTAEQWEILPS